LVDPKDAPDDKAVYAAEATMRKELEGLVAAPINDPTVGPALLTGRAAAVFFPRSLRPSRRRPPPKDVTEGQTFSKKSRRTDPAGFSEHHRRHDHEKARKAGPLGYYQFDDEGVPAQSVALVDHGVLKNFEMSRSPLVGFPIRTAMADGSSVQHRFLGRAT